MTLLHFIYSNINIFFYFCKIGLHIDWLLVYSDKWLQELWLGPIFQCDRNDHVLVQWHFVSSIPIPCHLRVEQSAMDKNWILFLPWSSILSGFRVRLYCGTKFQCIAHSRRKYRVHTSDTDAFFIWPPNLHQVKKWLQLYSPWLISVGKKGTNEQMRKSNFWIDWHRHRFLIKSENMTAKTPLGVD